MSIVSSALDYLRQSSDPVRLTDLATALSASQTSVGNALNTLCAKGLATKVSRGRYTISSKGVSDMLTQTRSNAAGVSNWFQANPLRALLLSHSVTQWQVGERASVNSVAEWLDASGRIIPADSKLFLAFEELTDAGLLECGISGCSWIPTDEGTQQLTQAAHLAHECLDSLPRTVIQ